LADLKRSAFLELLWSLSFAPPHIEKAIFVTLASIFSETVGKMKLEFGEEIEKKLIYQDPSPSR